MELSVTLNFFLYFISQISRFKIVLLLQSEKLFYIK